MARLFAYKARGFKGERISGFLEAESEAAVDTTLRAKNLFVVEVRPAAGRDLEISRIGIFRRKVSQRQLAFFCRQLAAMIGAGLPVFQALNILALQAENPRLGEVLGKIVGEVERGMSLAEAFSLHPEIFPPVFTSMVEAGEVSGSLAEVLERLAVHFEREHEVREKVRSALAYPVIVIVVAFLAVMVLTTFVVPTFARILADLNIPLPLPTRMLMAFGLFMRENWYFVFATLVIGIAALRYLVDRTAQGREIRDRLLLRLPVVGALLQKVIIARFARTLAAMVRSGVPILTALEVVKRAAGNIVISRAIEETIESVSEGGPIAGLLEKSGVFPLMVTRMVAVGEQTGTLDELLEKVAGFYDRDVTATVERLVPTIEPAMIIGLAVIVGGIMLSVLLPLFSIYGQM